MILLLPISRFRVDYQLAAGRPYSDFERLILKAISEGNNTVGDLADVFHVHRRLILEALVTLTHAGWLAVGGAASGDFSLTASGADAVMSGREPRSRVVEGRFAWVIMERLTGALSGRGDIKAIMTRDVADIHDLTVKLPERISERRLTEAQVDQFLPRSRSEWLHRMTSIDMRSRRAYWIAISLDPKQGIMDAGLPLSWKPRVAPAILEFVASRLPGLGLKSAFFQVSPPIEGDLEPDAPDARVVDEEGTFRTRISLDDLLATDGEHSSYLQRVVESAASKVFIASAFLRPQTIEGLRPALLAALKRGVTIDLLWGYRPGENPEGKTGVDVLKSVKYEVERERAKGRLRFNIEPSGSHAKLIIWDVDDGVEACIGSFNWLSAISAVAPTGEAVGAATAFSNVSLRLRQPDIVARLCRCAAGLWVNSRSGRLDATPDRWRRVASNLEEIESSGTLSGTDEGNATVRLIYDYDHEALLRTWLSNAKSRVVVVSHRFGIAALTRLVAAENRERGPEFEFLVLYGLQDVDPGYARTIEEVVTRGNGILAHLPGLHAKILIADDAVCITSYNFLSADPFGTSNSAREVGVEISCPELVDALRSRLKELPRSPLNPG